MKEFPNDPAMHEYRALVPLRAGRYQQASAAIHSILASGPGWDWTTLQSLYPDNDTYANQLAALEKAAAAKPDDPRLQFLLAYHYMTANQPSRGEGGARRGSASCCPTDSAGRATGPGGRRGGGEGRAEGSDANPRPTSNSISSATGWPRVPTAGRSASPSSPKAGSSGRSRTRPARRTRSTARSAWRTTCSSWSGSRAVRSWAASTALADNKFQFKVLGGGDADPGLTFAK